MTESCITCLHREMSMDEMPCSECQRVVGIDDITRTKYERKIVTNADHIRYMSDEKLIDLFGFQSICSYVQYNHPKHCEKQGAFRPRNHL